MKIADAAGNTLELPTPHSICRACLVDPAQWCSHTPILAVFCPHTASGAIWRTDGALNGKWVVRPTTREEHVRGLAAGVVAHSIRAAAKQERKH
jgi:hypothetical protein